MVSDSATNSEGHTFWVFATGTGICYIPIYCLLHYCSQNAVITHMFCYDVSREVSGDVSGEVGFCYNRTFYFLHPFSDFATIAQSFATRSPNKSLRRVSHEVGFATLV